MKNVIQPLLISTILGLVGCSGKEALVENQTTELTNQLENEDSEKSVSDNISTEVESETIMEDSNSDDESSLVVSQYDVSINEQTLVVLSYENNTASGGKQPIDVISHDESIVSASIENDKIIIEADTVEFETQTNVDVVSTDGSNSVLATIAVEIIPQVTFELNLDETEIQIEFLDTYYLPFTIDYDGDEDVKVAIEDVQGNTFATVELESTYSLSNTLIIQGNGVYETGTLSFNVVASTDSGVISTPVTVNVFPEVNITMNLSNETPTFTQGNSSFTIVRVCTDVSDDYELEITEVSGNGAITASLEGSVISITSADVEYDTTATFMVTASILGVSEVAYFDVVVEAI